MGRCRSVRERRPSRMTEPAHLQSKRKPPDQQQPPILSSSTVTASSNRPCFLLPPARPVVFSLAHALDSTRPDPQCEIACLLSLSEAFPPSPPPAPAQLPWHPLGHGTRSRSLFSPSSPSPR